MKWIAISGSWRWTNDQVEKDVRREIRKIIEAGNGIVTGGALGVDYIATNEATKICLDCSQIKIFLPATLASYCSHYRLRANEGIISSQQAEDLISQLSHIININPMALIENSANKTVNKMTYFERNSAIVNAADELIAFHINQSEGVQDTINKAKIKDIPIRVLKYEL